jgi:hypothetical protein
MSLSAYFQQFLSVFVAVGVFRPQKDPTYRFRADEDANLTGQVMRRGKRPAVGITIDYIKRGESLVETGYA